MTVVQKDESGEGGSVAPPSDLLGVPPIDLSDRADELQIERPSLRDRIADRVLSLFSWSLLGTLAFAGALVLIDSLFIYSKVISHEQRLMSERIIMTFVTATVVQVGAAVAAIVFAVFKTDRVNSTHSGD